MAIFVKPIAYLHHLMRHYPSAVAGHTVAMGAQSIPKSEPMPSPGARPAWSRAPSAQVVPSE